jgi:peptide/nickel transport system substrate-binding protein
VIFLDMGTDTPSKVSGMKSGVIDTIDFGDSGSTQAFLALREEEGVVVRHVASAQTRVLRMRVDKKPWNDNRVRTALRLCQHREKILKLAYFNEGLLGQDFHVYPNHPEYCEQPTPNYDPERARQLLQEAGYSEGLRVNLTVGKGWQEIMSYAEILKSDALPAGFNIRLQSVSTTQYQSNWSEVDLGITPWYHRPLGTMALNLGYSTNDQGQPTTWNETRWVDKEFNSILEEANGTLDVQQRRKLFCKLEKIQQNRGSIGNAFWMNNFSIFRSRVKGLLAHPNSYLNLENVWVNKRADKKVSKNKKTVQGSSG